MATVPTSDSARNTTLDAFRFMAFIAVVLIHTASPVHFGGLADITPASEVTSGDVIDVLCRFAVPFFFATSGYFFFARRDRPFRPAFTRLAWRVGIAFLVWAVLYNLSSIPQIIARPRLVFNVFLLGGQGFQLWFLPALLLSVATTEVLLRLVPWWPVRFGLAILAYLASLAFMGYAPLIAGHTVPKALTHAVESSPCLGGPFVFFGAWLACCGWRCSASLALAIVVAGAALSLAEAEVLAEYEISPHGSSDFFLGTMPFGCGMLLLALALPSRAKWPDLLAPLSRLSFGLYCVHVFFVISFGALVAPTTLSGRLLVAALVVAASLLIVEMLSRVRALRPLLM